MECEFCNHKFSNKSSLRSHQRRAKYCLKLRGKEEYNFECSGCGKKYTSKENLQIHEASCISINSNTFKSIIESKDIEIKELKVHIKELENKLENIALKAVSRPTTTNKTQINTYIQNMEPVTTEHLIDNAQHLTIEHIKKGVEGYAEYALEYPLKNRMLCSDYSRRKVKFKDRDGNVITDPEMTTLAKKFFKSIHEKNKELICKSANELKEKLGDENVMDTVVKLFDYKEAVNRGCDGEKTDFHHDFVRQVCSQTLKE
jgi:hypothetical protein